MPVTFNGGIALTSGSFTLTDPPPFTIQAAEFDGADDRLFHSGALSTITDTRTGLVSLWYKTDTTAVNNRMIHITDTPTQPFSKFSVNLAEGHFNIAARTVGTNAVPLNISTINTYPTGTWIHALASWDLATTTAQIYINGISDFDLGSTVVNQIIDYTFGDTAISGLAHDSSLLWDGCLSELYFTNEFLDLSVQANREKFILAGLPVDLTDEGDPGALPTGTAPILYFTGGGAAFPTNLGTGGSFTVQGGGLTNCVDTPTG